MRASKSAYTSLAPGPETARVDWQELEERFAWLAAMADCPQDPVFHAEGDVLIHTRLVVEALIADSSWRMLPAQERRILFWAALLHDVAKPATTRRDEQGRITARGHSRRGQIMARAILWRLGAPFEEREKICHLITHHQVPFYWSERERPERLLHRISHQTRCDWLTVLAHADVTGRICNDAARLHDSIALFAELADEEGCRDAPKVFPSVHSRFLYFRREDRSPAYHAHDDWRGRVTLLSGLPASGKDTWIARHRDEAEVISLDDLRTELDIDPAGPQGAVVAAARERAKVALRAGQPLIWNGINLSYDRRAGLIDLFADYTAKVHVVYAEASEDDLARRNAARDSPVPLRALARMLDHWQPPDLTECHSLDVVLS